MNKLRDNTAVILWILVISFGLIWVLNDVGTFDYFGNQSRRFIGSVNGEEISIEDYNRAVEAQMQAYQQQTGETMPPQMQDLERERVFNALVEDRLREQEMERLGISVSDDELYEMIMGPNPHPIIRQYFNDGKGGVNRALLQNFADDPQATEQWVQLEKYLRAERRREKLMNIVASTVRVSDPEVADEYARRNRSVNVRYTALRYADIPDAQVQVADSDLRAFYNENREDFKRKKTWTINYVTRSKQPTAEDTSRAFGELEKVRAGFAAATDDSLFLAQNASEQPYLGRFFKADEMPDELAAAVFEDPTPGRLLGPVASNGQAHLVKIQAVQPTETPSIKARHILISAPQNNPAALATARTRAEALKAQIAGGASFEDLARRNSDDTGSGAQGGNLGWFSRGRMVPEFEAASFTAPVGQVVGPVTTQYGVHLIQVTARANSEVKLADFVTGIRASSAALSAVKEQLEDLQYYAGESGDFKAEARNRKFTVQTATVEAEQQFIPDLGNSRKIMTFLEKSKADAISGVIELNDQYVVVHLEKVQPEGYRPFEEVKEELRPRVVLQKKREIQAAKMRDALKQRGYTGLAAALKTTEANAQGVTYNNPVVPGLGRELKFTGTALGLAPGATSDVVEGEAAVFVMQLVNANEPPAMTPQQRESLRQEMVSIRRSTLMNQWLASLRDKAEIEDNRSFFEQ